MTEHEYLDARAAIISVTTGRIGCVGLALTCALQGEWMGAGMFIAAVPLLHFALPVTR